MVPESASPPPQSYASLTPEQAFTPRPDPTNLTTQQLLRHTGNLREIIEARLDAMDKAVGLLHDQMSASPTPGEMLEMMKAIRELVNERDTRYAAEFLKLSSLSNMMADQQALALAATKEATSVAMAASEKAVAKAEAAAEKRFESINEFRAQLVDQQATFARTDLVNQKTEALEKKVDDLARAIETRILDNKDRITTIESRKAGMSDGWGYLAGALGVAGIIVGIVATIIGTR